MKLGAEPKKVAILAGLLTVAVVVFFMNGSGSDAGAYTPPAPAALSSEPPAAETTPASPAGGAAPGSTGRQVRGRTAQEFRPSLRPRRGEQRVDPTTVDPTLRVDLLAKLQAVNVEGSRRSIFDFGNVPAEVKPDPAKLLAGKVKAPSPIVPVEPPKPAVETPPAKPTAPPIPLKFYGYISPVGQPQKRAFFVEGEDIHVVHEGELVRKRYKIVRIGVNSVIVEDTQFGSQQTLPLEEQPG